MQQYSAALVVRVSDRMHGIDVIQCSASISMAWFMGDFGYFRPSSSLNGSLKRGSTVQHRLQQASMAASLEETP